VGCERSDAAAVLVGMAEFVVRDAVEEDGEVWVLIETPPAVTGCRGCGTRAQSKGRRRTKVRDLECGGRPVVLVWDKRRWRCPDPDCDVRTWTEQVASIAPRAVLTERARYEIFRLVGEEARSTAEVARSFGVAWGTAWDAFEAHARPAVEDPARIDDVEALGIDETGFLAATPTHPRIFATGLVDVRRGLLCDVIEGRSASELREWLASRPPQWLAGVRVVTIDPHEPYRLGLHPDLAHTTVVADPFHIVRVRREAPCIRVGCKDPPAVCRSRPLKLRAA
jgi:transposase